MAAKAPKKLTQQEEYEKMIKFYPAQMDKMALKRALQNSELF